jgi:hypothetical protein
MADETTEKKIEVILARQQALLQKQIASEEKLGKLRGENLSRLDKQLAAAEKTQAYQKKLLDTAAELANIGEREIENNLKNLRLQQQATEDKIKDGVANDRDMKYLVEKAAKQADQLKFYEEVVDAITVEGKISKEALETFRGQTEELEKQAAALKKNIESQKNLVDVAGDYLSELTGISDEWKKGQTFTSAILRTLSDMTDPTKDLQTSLEEMGKKFKETFSLENIGASAIMKTVEATKRLMIEQTDQLANYRRLTGLGGEYNTTIVETQQELAYLGLVTQDVVQATNALEAANSTFVFENENVRKSLQKTTATFEQSFDASVEAAGAMGVFSTTLGMTAAASEQATLDMAAAAMAMKKAPKEILAEFAQLGPQLAAWGPNTQKVFLETAAAAKALNIETSELLDIAAGFDTFDDAADRVGQLNAALGGDYFDTVEMVMATESERIDMILSGIDATGKSFGDMGRFEKKRLAEAAGMTVDQLAKIANGNRDLYDELQEFHKDTEMTYNDLSAAAKENMGITEKLDAIVNSLAYSFDFLINAVLTVLGWIQSVQEATDGWAGRLLGLLFVVKMAGKGLGLFAAGAVKGVLTAFTSMTAAAAPAAGGIQAVGTAIGTAGAAAAPAVPALLSVAAVFASIGVAATGVGFGISLIIDSISGLISTTSEGMEKVAGLVGMDLIGVADDFDDIADSVDRLGSSLASLDMSVLEKLAKTNMTLTAKTNMSALEKLAKTNMTLTAKADMSALEKLAKTNMTLTAKAVPATQNTEVLNNVVNDAAAAGTISRFEQLRTVELANNQQVAQAAPAAQAPVGAPIGYNEVVLRVDSRDLGKVMIPIMERAFSIKTKIKT